ncbi:MAG TPA: Hsp70 family protein [Chthoniobacteraceae bacterium]|jgi:molecular chaperone DnaK
MMDESGTPLHRRAVGIDLGTTFSAIACLNNFGKPQLIPNAENERLTPSVILFEDGQAIVGSIALQNAVANPQNIVDFVKREMGKSRNQFHRIFHGRAFTAEELSALILTKLKHDGEKHLGETITDAVITVPAYFNDAERTATINAGQMAGLNVLQVINEPTAAALAYGIDKLDQDQTVLVFDLGGGTFDVTIMRIESHHITMLASNGDHRLGGKDWDDIICDWIAEEFDREHNQNPMLDLHSYQDLYLRSLNAKIQLSSRAATTVVHQFEGKSVKVEINREEFERRTKHLSERCKMICEIALEEARLDGSKIDRILLTGGMTRIPSIREMIVELAKGVSIDDGFNPDEAVAAGAAIQANLLLLREENATGERALPTTLRERFSTDDGELFGVTNITTHTLGVVLWDEARNEEYVFPMIPRMTAIPAEKQSAFGLARHGMEKVTVRVVEGESTVPGECTVLGHCVISLPSGMAKGDPITLTYCYDESQVLEVLVDAGGKQARAVIDRNNGLSEDEIAQSRVDLGRFSAA